ncbi:MAG: F0F1 ATP synthase subunit delta [Alphaproteobacteria bacterium]|nr:MAG: F0F1 ATP synthase subunit delta [Alphaproteobacteria bacterium]
MVGRVLPGSRHGPITPTKGLKHELSKGLENVSNSEHVLAGVAQRYATALFDLAEEAGVVDSLAEELQVLQGLLGASADLKGLVSSPLYSREDQTRALQAVLDKASASQLLKNFVGLVAHNRRLFALSDMIKAFQMILARKRGEISASVTSAVPLGEHQVADLKAALREALGRDVQLQTDVDESLLGGLIVKVGSRMVDSSLKTKLSNLKIAMKEVG